MLKIIFSPADRIKIFAQFSDFPNLNLKYRIKQHEIKENNTFGFKTFYFVQIQHSQNNNNFTHLYDLQLISTQIHQSDVM